MDGRHRHGDGSDGGRRLSWGGDGWSRWGRTTLPDELQEQLILLLLMLLQLLKLLLQTLQHFHPLDGRDFGRNGGRRLGGGDDRRGGGRLLGGCDGGRRLGGSNDGGDGGRRLGGGGGRRRLGDDGGSGGRFLAFAEIATWAIRLRASAPLSATIWLLRRWHLGRSHRLRVVGGHGGVVGRRLLSRKKRRWLLRQPRHVVAVGVGHLKTEVC